MEEVDGFRATEMLNGEALSEQVELESDWSSGEEVEGANRSLECPRLSCSNLLPIRLPHVRKPAGYTKEKEKKELPRYSEIVLYRPSSEIAGS